MEGVSQLARALTHLSLGRAAIALGQYGEARVQLDQGVDRLRTSGNMDDVPRGLLARAALLREICDLSAAEHELKRSAKQAS